MEQPTLQMQYGAALASIVKKEFESFWLDNLNE
jgi:hypothetical protein